MTTLGTLSQSVLSQPFFSLKDPGHGGFLFLLTGAGGCGKGAQGMASGGTGFRLFLFTVQIMKKIKILNSIKQVP